MVQLNGNVKKRYFTFNLDQRPQFVPSSSFFLFSESIFKRKNLIKDQLILKSQLITSKQTIREGSVERPLVEHFKIAVTAYNV